MTEINKYLAEEVGIDFADGLIPRREALRRLLLMGLSASSAAALLTACARGVKRQASPSPRPASSERSSPAGQTPVRAENTGSITFAGPAGRSLKAAWAPAATPKGALLVIHENRGLNDHIRSVAGRLAGDGYSALAIDLLSEEGGSESFQDPAQAMAALSSVPPERFVEDMKAGLSELSRRASDAKLAAVGFCFGGGMVWRLLASGEPRLAAAVPFYGPFPENGTLTGSKAAVLGIYAGLDQRVNATREAAEKAVEQAGLPHEFVTFPNADHAFFNDTGPRYNPEAAKNAYSKMLDWFNRYLAA